MDHARMRRILAVLATAVLALTGAACGSDDDDGGGATTTTSGDAPTGGGEDAVDVEMQDHAFVVGGDLVAGGTIRLSNTGDEYHMMGLGKLEDGATLADVQAALAEEGGDESGEDGSEGDEADEGAGASTTAAGGGEDEGEGEGEGEEEDPFAGILEEVGAPGGLMGPDQAAGLTAPALDAGSYALICFLPTEGPDATPHFALGMIGQLEVVEGDAAEPEADATYTITPGEAIDGPASLPAGEQVLKIEGTDIGALEPILVKPDAGKTFADIDAAFDTFDEELPVDAAEKTPGDLIVAVFDLEDNESISLGVDLTPGTYELVAPDTDSDDEGQPEERIVITVT